MTTTGHPNAIGLYPSRELLTRICDEMRGVIH
jgi:hypothetical protein